MLLVNVELVSVIVLAKSKSTPPPLPVVASLLAKRQLSEESWLPDRLTAPPAGAEFDVKLLAVVVAVLPAPAYTAPPSEPVAVFCSKRQLFAVSVLASRLTAPPFVAAVFIENLVPVPSKVPDNIPYTAPPMLVASFMEKMHPALSVTVPPRTVMPPPIWA
eukprot:1935717-Rhodomonas_salina.2